MLIAAGVSKLSRVKFARNPHPALLKEPREFWDVMYIANEDFLLDKITHPRIRKKLAYDPATHTSSFWNMLRARRYMTW